MSEQAIISPFCRQSAKNRLSKLINTFQVSMERSHSVNVAGRLCFHQKVAERDTRSSSTSKNDRLKCAESVWVTRHHRWTANKNSFTVASKRRMADSASLRLHHHTTSGCIKTKLATSDSTPHVELYVLSAFYALFYSFPLLTTFYVKLTPTGTCTHTHTRTHAHTHTRTHARTHACTHARTYARTQTQTHRHTNSITNNGLV